MLRMKGGNGRMMILSDDLCRSWIRDDVICVFSSLMNVEEKKMTFFTSIDDDASRYRRRIE
ncbi:hypothetical protein WH47_08201 [Habropoda laboriosa]|uniref:Uncharacterized protein n=1 Tax=Habropoda laboriosa TaxID=597456 RepID=A0A0L7RGF8_9HYME|nr:hypothetical protein WH47_08201 [Habropoda laboriosa]